MQTTILYCKEVLLCSDKIKPKTIQVTGETKGALDALKHRGQSYNGLIQELVEFWKKAHPVNKVRGKAG